MDFDETLIRPEHVREAIARYDAGEKEKHKARSAFLIHSGKRYPAKHLIRLAFHAATGAHVRSEQLTGGKASVRVLAGLGFDAIYEPPKPRPNRNAEKSARRAAFRKVIGERWGEVQTEASFTHIRVPNFLDRPSMAPDERRILDSIERVRGYEVKGRANLRLKFDFYLPAVNLCIEFDERQHFTPARAASLRAYPESQSLGFDRSRWIALSEEIRAGDNSPMYRDEQRAFYDSLRDLRATQVGCCALVRIYENDVEWEKANPGPKMEAVLASIDRIIRLGPS